MNHFKFQDLTDQSRKMSISLALDTIYHPDGSGRILNFHYSHLNQVHQRYICVDVMAF